MKMFWEMMFLIVNDNIKISVEAIYNYDWKS